MYNRDPFSVVETIRKFISTIIWSHSGYTFWWLSWRFCCWLLWHQMCAESFWDSCFYTIAERCLCIQFVYLLRPHQQQRKTIIRKVNLFCTILKELNVIHRKLFSWATALLEGHSKLPNSSIYDALSAFASCCGTASNLVLQCNMTRSPGIWSLMQCFSEWSPGTPVQPCRSANFWKLKMLLGAKRWRETGRGDQEAWWVVEKGEQG